MGGRPEARWRLHPQDAAGQRALAGGLGVHPITAQVLISRGVQTEAAGRAFLQPSLAALQSPSAIAGMEAAVLRLVRAIRARAPVVVYGDYDADGVTATAILVRALRAAGASADFYVPDRQTEGYGLHADAVQRLASSGAGLIVAVDCGITALAAAEASREAGADLIILDHHLPVGRLPRAAAIVNPRISGEPTDYCAAGLAYQCARGVRELLGDGLDDPDLLGLAALGTVADAVPLRDGNRIIVAHGLSALGASGLPGVHALLAAADVQAPVSARDVSHALAPRINAAGRLAHASAAVRLLLSDDPGESAALAGTLDRLNGDRRALCDLVLAAAVDEVETSGMADAPAIVLGREGWHPGVVGIVASQLVERYYRPAIVIAIRDQIGKGSGRSIPPLHLVDTLARTAALLEGYGGHAMAAGLTVPAHAIPRFRDAFLREAGAALSDDDLVPVVDVDAEVGLETLTPALADELARIAPYGVGNPEPILVTRGVRAVGTRTVGNGAHLRLIVSDGTRSADAIGFRLGDQAEILAFTQARLDLAYGLERDRWGGEQAVQLIVERLWTPEVDPATITVNTADLLARLFGRAEDYLGAQRVEFEDLPAFHTKVVGVTFDGRQDLLPTVKAGQRLRLIRDPANPRDPHAIKVSLQDGRQLGFLRAALAARLAPAIDAGARYVATATALTGGGGHAWGLNIHVERRAPWSGDIDAESVAVPPPCGEAFFDWVTARLTRGRPLPVVHREVLRMVLGEQRVVLRHGPGRGLLAATAAAAAALLAAGRRPVLLVLPRAVEVDAWTGAMGPWMRVAGLRLLGTHGALPARARSRVDEALARGSVDVVAASAAWAAARAPCAGAVIVVADEVCSEQDLSAIHATYGDAVRLVWGPASRDRLGLAAGAHRASGAASLAGAHLTFAPRTNVRVVDRRGRARDDAATRNGAPRPERALVVTSDPAACVATAHRLREMSPEAAADVAYYHDGLPAALRRALEDLYAAGRIATLVTGSLFVQPGAPLDVGRVVAAGLPPTRLLAGESLGTGGLGGQTAVVELAYAPDAPREWVAARAAIQPARDSLVRCYQHLRGFGQHATWTWPEAAARGAAAGLSTDLLATALEVFLEAGVVSAEGPEGEAAAYTLTGPSARVDLQRSLRYREAVREQAALEDLREWASGPAAAILAELARP